MDILSEKLEKKFGNKIRKIEGNLYSVKRTLINLSEPFDPDAKILKGGNPRWVSIFGGKESAKGLQGTDKDKKKAERLMNSIKDRGLKHPLDIRLLGGKLICVDGERRWRVCEKLAKSNEQCYDQSDGQIKPAKEVLEELEVRIEEMSEEDHLELAITQSETHEPIGHAATTNVVRSLIKHFEKLDIKEADTKIRKIMGGKSDSWLRDTKILMTLDKKTFAALHNEIIDRQVAIALAKISTVQERLQRLADICAAVEEHVANKKEKIQTVVDRLQEREDFQEAEIIEQELEDEDTSATERKLEKTRQKIEDKQKEIGAIDQTRPVATTKHLTRAEDKAKRTNKQADVRINPLAFSVVYRKWLPVCEEYIESEGYDEDGEDSGIDPDDCILIKMVLEIWKKGRKEKDGTPYSIDKILRHHNKKKSG